MNVAADTEAREMVVAALVESNVPRVRQDPGVARFLEGAGDVALTDLEMDSLARMEFCISIELETGLSLVPDEIHRLGTLGRVADRIRASRS